MASENGRIFITGANRGLGLGLTREFARRKWKVFAGCRHPAAAAELTALENSGVQVMGLDVRDDVNVREVFSGLAQEIPGLDVVINNAGINPDPRDLTVAEVPIAQVTEALDINLVGALRVLQGAIPLLQRSARPRIVNISSGAGSLTHNSANRPQPAYCLSKAGLNMLTRRAARELSGITVVSVSPGWIRTDMGGRDAALGVDEVAAALAATIDQLTLEQTGQWLDRFGQPSEYAW